MKNSSCQLLLLLLLLFLLSPTLLLFNNLVPRRHALCAASADEGRSDNGEVVCVRGIGKTDTLGARQWLKR